MEQTEWGRTDPPSPNSHPPSLPALPHKVLLGSGGEGTAGHPSLTKARLVVNRNFYCWFEGGSQRQKQPARPSLITTGTTAVPWPCHTTEAQPPPTAQGLLPTPQTCPSEQGLLRAPVSVSASQHRAPLAAGSLASLP